MSPAAREYDSFGNLIPNSETGTWVTRFSYQGQSWWAIRSADGLKTFFKSLKRDYDSATGRFLQNEPLLGRRPFAQYLYAAQSPLSLVDPLGLAGCDASLSKKIETIQCANAPETTYKRAPNDAVEGLMHWDKKYEDAFRAELSGNTRQEIDQLLSRRRPLREQMDAAPGTFTYLVNTLTLGLPIDINQMNATADKAAREYDAITNRLLSIENSDPRYPRILRRQNDWIQQEWNPLQDPIFLAVPTLLSVARGGAAGLLAEEGGGSSLVHLTDVPGASGINTSGTLIGRQGSYAVPESVAAESTGLKLLRTGLTPARIAESVV